MNVRYRLKKAFNDRITKYGATVGIHRWTIDKLTNPYLRDLEKKYYEKYKEHFGRKTTHEHSIIAPYEDILTDFNKLVCKGMMCDRYNAYPFSKDKPSIMSDRYED